MADPVRTLAALLDDAGLRPVASAEQIAPSTVYDLQYRLAIVACAFERHAARRPNDELRLVSSKLKLLQFVAVRPWLETMIEEWSRLSNEPQRSLLHSQRLRRGFLGDHTHDRVVNYLIANRILRTQGNALMSGAQVEALSRLCGAVREHDLFGSERGVLERLAKVRITNAMLAGW